MRLNTSYRTRKMKNHINIPIFIPHLGCPNICVFCNQVKISGCAHADFSSVRHQIDEALTTVKDGQTAQLAYFGGSFTGIDREDMIYLLSLAKEYIDRGAIESVRLSTRPDYIDEEILDILSRYGVRSIELGLQSMSDKVLTATKRGHDAAAAERAMRLIRDRGFGLTGQMMIGLPSSAPQDEIYTARRIMELGADSARVYPTVVFCGTELENMAKRGEYVMPTLDELIDRTSDALYEFAERNIPVIRVGLQNTEVLQTGDGVYSDTYTPAMGEICMSRVYRRLICEALDKVRHTDSMTLTVARGETSKAIGQHGDNRKYISQRYGIGKLTVRESDSLTPYRIELTDTAAPSQ